jgi:RimJ/RimL family protein N-acetyltransferase
VSSSRVVLRPAVSGDARLVFEWRNLPYIVARASSQRAVDWQEHLLWFEETIRSEDRLMFLVERDGLAIGQVRFDRRGDEHCLISAYLLPEWTGKGYGIEAIRAGCAEAFRRWKVEEVGACVRLDNPAAHSAFLKAGFGQRLGLRICPEGHAELVLSREAAQG